MLISFVLRLFVVGVWGIAPFPFPQGEGLTRCWVWNALRGEEGMARREGTSCLNEATEKIILRGVQLLNVINGFGERKNQHRA